MIDSMAFNIALFNLSDEEMDVSVDLKSVPDLPREGTFAVRDLWARKDLFPVDSASIVSRTIEAHGAQLLQLKG